MAKIARTSTDAQDFSATSSDAACMPSRPSIVIGFLTAVIVACGGCSNSPVAPVVPKTVSPPPNQPSTPFIVKLEVTGPSVVPLRETVQFFAIATMSDNSVRDYTQQVRWSLTGPIGVLSISNDGHATGVSSGPSHVIAESLRPVGTSDPIVWGFADVTVLPANTFKLTGTVTESGMPVSGANVAVVSGVGSGLVATTVDGYYQLYGVAGDVQIKVSKAGYDDLLKSTTVTESGVLDFPDARQTAAVASVAGDYTFTIVSDPGCAGTASLPSDLRQRTYPAVVTQTGPALRVSLSGDFATDRTGVLQNSFVGRVEPGDVLEFYLGTADDLTPPGTIVERVAPSLYLSFFGRVVGKNSAAGVNVQFDGGFNLLKESSDHPDPWFEDVVYMHCIYNGFSLTRVASSNRTSSRR